MINIKKGINFQKYEFDIFYYEKETFSDFEYLILTMTIQAFDKKIELLDLIDKFTKGENDIKVLLVRKFKSIFKVDINSFRQIEDLARKMLKEEQKLKDVHAIKNVPFNNDLELFFLKNEFLNEKEMIKILSLPYKKNKSYVYVKTTVKKLEIGEINNKRKSEEEIEKKIDIDFQLNLNFETFNVLNLNNIKNKNIINELKEILLKKSNDFISFKHENFKSIKEIDNSFKTITRKYGVGSNYSQLGEYGSIIKNTMVEYYSINKEIISTLFFEYKKIPFIQENIISYEKFKTQAEFNELLKLLENSNFKFSNSFEREFIRNANTLEEFNIIKNKNWYQLDEKYIYNLIPEMIKFRVNLINDEFVVKTKFVNHHFHTNKIELYSFLNCFFPKEEFKDISETKKIEILYDVYKKNSSLLNKEHHKFIEEKIKNYNFINETINKKISSISAMRGEINSEIERLEKIKKSLNVEEEKISYVEKISKIMERNCLFKKYGNFFTHIKESKEFKGDIREIKNYNELFLNLKKDILKNPNKEFGPEPLNDKYIDILTKLEKDFIDTIKYSKKIK